MQYCNGPMRLLRHKITIGEIGEIGIVKPNFVTYSQLVDQGKHVLETRSSVSYILDDLNLALFQQVK
jgi:hypothetical protein